MDSSLECGDKKAQGSSREEPYMHPPSVLLVILFWHHVIFFLVTVWCAIGIVATPESTHTLANMLVIVAVQTVCAVPGLLGALQKNMKFIYYFAAVQGLLAVVEFFWAMASFFVVPMLIVLLLFCLYQAFLCVCALRCALKECEWAALDYIWPFDMGTHPNYLPSYADKLNEQPSQSLYGTLSGRRRAEDVLTDNIAETKATVEMNGLQRMFRALSPKSTRARAADSPLVVHAGDGHLSSQNTPPAIVKSMHPASSELSTTSSTKSQRVIGELKTPPHRVSPPAVDPNNNTVKNISDDKPKRALTPRQVAKTAIERPSSVTAVADAKTSSATATSGKTNTKRGMPGIMSQIFGPTTTLNAPPPSSSSSRGARKSPPSRQSA